MPDAVEWASVLADILGIGGALALARPFYRRQPERDALIAYFFTRARTPHDVGPIFETARVAAERVLTHADGDYRTGCWGAFAIAIAFLLKLIESLARLIH